MWLIWTASSEYGSYSLCEQRRFRRACASAQSRQNLRCSLIQAVSQEEPSDRKPDPWLLWMAGHTQLKFVMTECSRHKFAWRGSYNCYKRDGKTLIRRRCNQIAHPVRESEQGRKENKHHGRWDLTNLLPAVIVVLLVGRCMWSRNRSFLWLTCKWKDSCRQLNENDFRT